MSKRKSKYMVFDRADVMTVVRELFGKLDEDGLNRVIQGFEDFELKNVKVSSRTRK